MLITPIIQCSGSPSPSLMPSNLILPSLMAPQSHRNRRGPLIESSNLTVLVSIGEFGGSLTRPTSGKRFGKRNQPGCIPGHEAQVPPQYRSRGLESPRNTAPRMLPLRLLFFPLLRWLLEPSRFSPAVGVLASVILTREEGQRGRISSRGK